MVLPLENNTDHVVKKLAAQRIRADRGKNILIIMAVVLTTVLFAAVFAVAGGFLDQWKQIQRQRYGNAHGTIKFLTQQQYEMLTASDQVREVYYTRLAGTAENEELAKLDTEVRYAQDGSAHSFNCYPSTGRMPQDEDEIATSTLVLDALGVPCELGETVRLMISVDGVSYEKEFGLCGFWEGYELAGAQEAWVSESCADSIAPAAQETVRESGKYGGIYCADIYFESEWNLEAEMNALLADLGEESGIYELPISVNPSYGLGIPAEEIDPSFLLAVLALLCVIILVGYLIIYNMFVISVTQDIQFFGLLRTIGASGKQIRRIVRKQAFLLAAAGLPFGLAAGYLIGLLFLPYVLTQINIDDTGVYRINPAILAGAVLFSLLTVYISSLKPCRYAARISAIEAVRYAGGDSGVRAKTKRSRRITPVTMAAGNLRRNRKKAVLVVLSLSLGMILLNATYTAVSGFDMEAAIRKYAAADFYLSDYSVLHTAAVPWEKNLEGISESLREEIDGLQGLEDRADVYAKRIYQEIPDEMIRRVMETEHYEETDGDFTGSPVQTLVESGSTGGIVYGLDDPILDFVTLNRGTIDRKMWEAGEGVIVDDFYYHENGEEEAASPLYRIGDKISLTDEKGDSHVYTVMAAGRLRYEVGTHFYTDLGLSIMLPTESYRKLYGKTQALCTLFNVEEAYREDAENWAADYCSHVEPDLDYVSYKTYERNFRKEKRAYMVIGGVLSAVLALIGLLNFINVTITSLLARQRELAVLGAAGMEQRQMMRMLACEGMAYIGLAVFVTATAGTGIGYFLCNELAGNMWEFRYRFTLLPVALCLPVLVAVAIFVPIGFYRKMSRRSINI